MWNAERDACDDCRTCKYFLHEFWNCQGDTIKCDEYIVARTKETYDYKRAIEQMEHDALYEPTYNSEDGSM